MMFLVERETQIILGVIVLCLTLCGNDILTHRSLNTTLRSPGQTNPSERLAYLQAIRGNSLENHAAREQAIKRIRRQLDLYESAYQRDAGISDWESLGPDNEGGRVRGLAVNPQNGDQVFAGGVGGGIWESIDGGGSWSLATPPELSYAITWITFHPTNGNVIYATTGEFMAGGATNITSGAFMDLPGVGLLKSTDNGNTWSIINPDPGNDFWLSKVIVNPLFPDTVYVSGSGGNINQGGISGRVYRSDDAGATWQWTTISSSNNVVDIEIDRTNTSTIYIGTFNDVLKSTDSGMSFFSMSGNTPNTPINNFDDVPTNVTDANPRRCDVSICAEDPSTVYVSRYIEGTIDLDTTSIDSINHSEVWRTDDSGDNWTLLSRTTSDNSADAEEVCIFDTQGWYDNIAWADPIDCSRAVFGGINLWKWASDTLTRISDDDDDIGGATGGGNNSIHADQHNIVAHPEYGVSNLTVYIANDGGVYKTTNIWTAGPNVGWSTCVPGLDITQLYGVAVSRSGDTIYGGSQDNSFFVNTSVNSGSQNWIVTIRADGGKGGIKQSDPDIIYGSTQRGVFRKSTDGGSSFSTILNLNNSPAGDDNPLFISPFQIDPNDDETLYAGATNLWQSLDEGASWTSVYASSTGSVINTIEIADGDGNKIWVGHMNGQIWRTTNGGSQWGRQDVASMPNDPVTDIAINPNNHNELLVTFGGGYDTNVIWYTNDAGSSWNNRSLAFAMQMYSVIWHPQDPDWAYVGTDLGIFATENDGQDWSITPVGSSGHPSGNSNDGPVYTAVMELVWQGNGTDAHPYYLVAATHGRGIYRTTFPIRTKYYVDQTCNPCGLGSFSAPFATFPEAVETAGNGSEIIFLTGGTYNNVPPSLIVEKRLDITLDAASSPVIIE